MMRVEVELIIQNELSDSRKLFLPQIPLMRDTRRAQRYELPSAIFRQQQIEASL
jgi:hypothetical protein